MGEKKSWNILENWVNMVGVYYTKKLEKQLSSLKQELHAK